MENIIKEGRTRRDFLKGAGAVMAGGVVVGVVGSQLSCGDAQIAAPDWWTSDSDPLSLAPNAEAYLVMDSMKCASCSACMAACSLVNEGEANFLSFTYLLTNTFISKCNGENECQMLDP